MGMMIRIMFPLISYVSVATIITLAAGYGYLRRSGNLDDDRLFRIVALLHDVDIDAIASQHETDVQDVPGEEPSHQQQLEQMQIATLHFQAKADDIEKQHSKFRDLRKEVDAKMRHLRQFRDEVETFLIQHRDQALKTGLMAVSEQWQNLSPKKQTKELLNKMIVDNRTDLVILLLNGMPSKKRTDILKTLNTEEDLATLYKIQKQMLDGQPVKAFIDEQIQKLEQRSDLENN